MTNTTLIKLLKTFSPEEMKRFEEYIRSPFFNKNATLVKFFDHIKDHYPDFEHAEMGKENIFNILYPHRNFTDGLLRNLNSDLVKLALGFLKIMNYDSNTSNIDVLRSLGNRKLSGMFEKHFKATDKQLHEEEGSDLYFLNKLYLETVKINFQIGNSARLEKLDTPIKSNEYLISFFLIRFFRINYNLLLQKYNFEFEHSLELIKELVQYIEGSRSQYKPIISIYYYMFMTALKKEDNSYYFKLKEELAANSSYLERIERFNLQAALQNYCMQKILNGDYTYYEELFSVYTNMLENKLYSYEENGYIPVQLFRNMVNTASRLNNTDWAETFMEKYKSKLHPEYRDNVVNFSLAFISLERKNHEKALELLSKVRYDSVLDKPVVKVMLLKIHYEMGFFVELESQIDSSRHFINNDKLISKLRKDLFANFVIHLNELNKLRAREGNACEIERLKTAAQALNMFEREWILQKADELLSSKLYKKGAS